jgi:hypothetical protein
MTQVWPAGWSGADLPATAVRASPAGNPNPHLIPGTLAGSRLAPAILGGMCRNIRVLHNFEPPATEDEIQASALQYVRKISGASKPSAANAEAFQAAVEQVAQATRTLLDRLVTQAPPKDREVEAAKARARAGGRYATRT